MPQTEHDLRCCACDDPPIMAKYGIDADGNPYIHLKAWKGGRLIAEAVQTEGVFRVRCRKCLQWNKINIRGRRSMRVISEELPEAIDID